MQVEGDLWGSPFLCCGENGEIICFLVFLFDFFMGLIYYGIDRRRNADVFIVKIFCKG